MQPIGRPIPKDSIQNDSNPEGTIPQETIRNDLLAEPPQYVPIAHKGYPRWMRVIMGPLKPVPLAADLSSHPLTHGIVGGSSLGTAIGFLRMIHYIGENKLSLLTIVSSSSEKIPPLVALILRSTLYGQIFFLSVVGGCYFLYPQEMARRRAEHAALVQAEKRGDVNDVKAAFSCSEFQKLNSAWSFDKMVAVNSGVCACILAVAKSREFQKLSKMPTWQIVYAISSATGTAVTDCYNDWRNRWGGRQNLNLLRQKRWKESQELSKPAYSGGDNFTWLKHYREAREKCEK